MNPCKIHYWLLIVALAGCQELNLRSQSPDSEQEKDLSKEFETKVETPFVGDYTAITGLNLISLEGVGLVTGLDNTGGDPPPSMYRTRLLEDMKKRGIRNPNQILQSPTTALVVVRAYLPPLVRKGDHFDIEVRLPGNSESTSLNGGWLLETDLSEQAIVPGRGPLQGHIFARAKGPILISTGEGDRDSLAGVLRRGRVVAGGVSRRDRDLAVYLRNDFRSVRNSQRIASRIGERFHSYNEHGLKEALAEPKTDQMIVLKVPLRYRDNYPRFLSVVRKIAFRETTVAQRVRMQKLRKSLNTPSMAEDSALQLEAIGQDAVPVLKTGLKNPSLEVRFHAACALAYLEQPEGLEVLAEAARVERAFRVFAIAAMSAIDEPESHMLLQDLMNEQVMPDGTTYDSTELRYGAFRALSTLDENHWFIRGEKLNDEFTLHVLDTTGEPIIHLTHHKRTEIVLFGADQEFHTPIAVRAGNHIQINARPGSDVVTVSRYELGKEDQSKVVSRRVAEIIRTAAEFGATYPDIAQMLAQADKQNNIPGRIGIDSLPQSGRVYFRPDHQSGPGSKTKTRIGRANQGPNIFPDLQSPSDPKSPDQDDAADNAPKPSGGVATLSDARNDESDDSGDDKAKDADESKSVIMKDKGLLEILNLN